MIYKITFKNSVFRDLKKIDKGKSEQLLKRINKDLSEKPFQNPVLTGKFAGLRKYRIGNYRIIYSIHDDKVLILRIADRKNVYKKKS